MYEIESVEFLQGAELFSCKESELGKLSFSGKDQPLVRINEKDYKINLVETQTWNREEYKERVKIVPTSGTDEVFEFYVKNSAPATKKKLKNMPICAEKLLWQLFYWVKHVKKEEEGEEDYKDIVQNKMALVVKELVVCLKEEGFMNESVETLMSSLHDSRNFSDRQNIEKIVLNCLRRICSLDTEILIDLVEETRKAANILRGRDVVLLLGSSGAGKSTLIHYFAGTELQKTVKDGCAHFKLINPPKVLAAFHTSAKVDSETFSINAVEFEVSTRASAGISINSNTDSASANVEEETVQKQIITFCDTPGFRDTRGPEIDIANGIGICKAVREAKTVRPIILFCNDNFDKRFEYTLEMLDTIAALIPPNPYSENIIYWYNQLQLEKLQNDFIHTRFTQKLQIMKDGDSTAKSIPLINNVIAKLEANLKQPVTIDFLHKNPYDLLDPLIHNVIPPINHPSRVFRDFTSAENIGKYHQQLNFHEKIIKKTWERIVKQKELWKEVQQLDQNQGNSEGQYSLILQLHDSYALIKYKLNQLFQLYEALQIDQSNTIYESTMKFLRAEFTDMKSSYMDEFKSCTGAINRFLLNAANSEQFDEAGQNEIESSLSRCLDHALEVFWIEPILEIGQIENESYQVSEEEDELNEPFGERYFQYLLLLADGLESSVKNRNQLFEEEISLEEFNNFTAEWIGMKRSIYVLSLLQKLAIGKKNSILALSEGSKVEVLSRNITLPSKFEEYCVLLEKSIAKVNENLEKIPAEMKQTTISKINSFLHAVDGFIQTGNDFINNSSANIKEDVLILIGVYFKHTEIFPSKHHVKSFKEMTDSFDHVVEKASDYIGKFFDTQFSTYTLNKLRVFAWLNSNMQNLHRVQSEVELIHKLVGDKLEKWHKTFEGVMIKFVKSSKEVFGQSISKPTDSESISKLEKLLIIFRFFESCSALNKHSSPVYLSWLEQIQVVKDQLHENCMKCISALNSTSWKESDPIQLINSFYQYREFSKLGGKYIGEEMYDIFHSLDEDGDGFLSCADLQQTTKFQWGEDSSDEAIERVFKECDVNGDNQMEYCEFVLMVTTNDRLSNLCSEVEEIFDRVLNERISIDFNTLSNVERLIEIYNYSTIFLKEPLLSELFGDGLQEKLIQLCSYIEEELTRQLSKFSKELKFNVIENYADRWVGLEFAVRMSAVGKMNASSQLDHFRNYCVEFESCIDRMISNSFDVLIHPETSQMDGLQNSTAFIGLVTSLSQMRDTLKGKVSDFTLRFEADQRVELVSLRKKCFIDIPTNLLSKWVEGPNGKVPKFISSKLNDCDNLEVEGLKENISLLVILLPIDTVLINAVNNTSKVALEAYNERLRLLIDKAIAEIDSQNYKEVETIFKKTPPTKQLLEKLNTSILKFVYELQSNVVDLEITLTDIHCCGNLLSRWSKLIDSLRLKQYFAVPLKSAVAEKFRSIGEVFKSKLYSLYNVLNDFIAKLQFEQAENGMESIQMYLLSVEENVANFEKILQNNSVSSPPRSQLVEVGKQSIVKRKAIEEKVLQLLADYSKSMTNYCNHYTSILMQADLESIDDKKLDDDVVGLLKVNVTSNGESAIAGAVPDGTKKRRQSLGTATSNDSQHLTNLLYASLGKFLPKSLKESLVKAEQSRSTKDNSIADFYKNLLKAVESECDKQLQQLMNLFDQGHSDIISKEKLVSTIKDIITAYPVSAQNKITAQLTRKNKDIDEKKNQFRSKVNTLNKNGVASTKRMSDACQLLYENFNAGEYYFVMETKNEMRKFLQSSINDMKNKLKSNKFDMSKDFEAVSVEFETYCKYLRICSFLSKSHGFDNFIRSYDRSHEILDARSKDAINNVLTDVVYFFAEPIHTVSFAVLGVVNVFQQIVSGLPYIKRMDLLSSEADSPLFKLMDWKYTEKFAATFQEGLVKNALDTTIKLLSHYHENIQGKSNSFVIL